MRLDFITVVIGPLEHGDRTTEDMSRFKVKLKLILWNLRMLHIVTPSDYTPVAITL
jgi:hypothetical protein